VPDANKRIIIIGATSAIAEHCARIWIKDADVELVLVGRDSEKTERVAADLRVRNPQAIVNVVAANFTDPEAVRKLVDEIAAAGSLHTVLIAHGSLPDQSVCQQDLSAAHAALNLNGISPVLFAEAFVGHMLEDDSGTLAIIGSVAGDRGRKSNYFYGAAKGLVTRYAQGLKHRVAGTRMKVVLIKPGPTDTPMTAHLKQQGVHLAGVENVAKLIVNGVNRGKPVIYVPAKWALIMMVIRHLPRFVFNRLDI